ncbi:MAG: DUF3341 domain-containing protein [Gammaproteobacteria bacterium]|nr:DUF3341 domain-containing protein [Gammaproteobacteria bacterium]
MSVLGLFARPETALAAAKALTDAGHAVSLMSPYPIEGAAEALRLPRSPIRRYTLFGGLLGFSCGFGLAVFSATRHLLPTGGRPIIPLPPFLLIGYELTILFGVLATLLGFLICARLPAWRERPYASETAVDKYGVLLECGADGEAEAETRLRAAGAEAIRRGGELMPPEEGT